MENPLENPVILRHLFGYLPDHDLLRCSMLNNQWNYEVKSYLRDFRKLVAHVGGFSPCTVLNFLDQVLAKASNGIIPYTGLYVHISNHDLAKCDQTILKCENSFIGDEWKGLRYLKFKWTDGQTSKSLQCPCAKMIPFILSNNAETVEKLVFRDTPSDSVKEFNELFDFTTSLSINGTILLPNLKTLRWDAQVLNDFLAIKFMQRILHGGAPKLEALKVYLDSSNVLLCPADKRALLKRFEFYTEPEFELTNLKFLEAEPKLTELILHSHQREFYIPWNVITQFLRLSSDTLELLDIDIYSAARIHTVNESLPPLRKLRFFQIRVDRVDLRSANFRSCVAAIDFTRIFPLLSSSEFVLQLDMQRYTDNNDWVAEEIPPPEGDIPDDTVPAVKNLDISAECTLEETFPILSTMFPNVEELTFRGVKGNLDPHLLWNSWRKLRSVSLEIHAQSGEWNQELDSFFCGIHPEEAGWLREMDDTYLWNLHTVPVQPSLHLLEDLEDLEIILLQPDSDELVPVDLPEVISNVSSYLIFRHRPQLQTTIRGKGYMLQTYAHGKLPPPFIIQPQKMLIEDDASVD